MPNQSAEDFLINIQNKEIHYKNIFIEIPHGRISHWIWVFKTLSILFSRKGIKVHPHNIPVNVLGKKLSAILYSYHSEERLSHTNFPIFVSNQKKYFSSKFAALKDSIEKNEYDKIPKELYIFFQPISKYFTNRETINKLSKKLKIDAFTFLSRKKISIHLRNGDVAVLEKKKYLDSPIGSFFKSDYFCTDGFISDTQFFNSKNKENISKIRLQNLLKRTDKKKPINFYKKLIKEKLKEDYLVFIFSDGFTRIAHKFKEKTKCDYSPKEIEGFMNKIELPFEKDPNLIVSFGEDIKDAGGCNYLLNLIFSFRDKIKSLLGVNSSLDVVDLLCVAYNSDFVLAYESGFPRTLIEILKDVNYQNEEINI